MSNIGNIQMTYQLLEDFLKLKKGHKIIGVYNTVEDNINRKFNIAIEGPDMPEHKEDEELMNIYSSNILNVIEDKNGKFIENKGEENDKDR